VCGRAGWCGIPVVLPVPLTVVPDQALALALTGTGSKAGCASDPSARAASDPESAG
jgi:hypothetical protein